LSEEELENIRTSIRKGRPYGNDGWMNGAIRRFGLEITLRQPGRPRNGS